MEPDECIETTSQSTTSFNRPASLEVLTVKESISKEIQEELGQELLEESPENLPMQDRVYSTYVNSSSHPLDLPIQDSVDTRDSKCLTSQDQERINIKKEISDLSYLMISLSCPDAKLKDKISVENI